MSVWFRLLRAFISVGLFFLVVQRGDFLMLKNLP